MLGQEQPLHNHSMAKTISPRKRNMASQNAPMYFTTFLLITHEPLSHAYSTTFRSGKMSSKHYHITLRTHHIDDQTDGQSWWETICHSWLKLLPLKPSFNFCTINPKFPIFKLQYSYGKATITVSTTTSDQNIATKTKRKLDWFEDQKSPNCTWFHLGELNGFCTNF